MGKKIKQLLLAVLLCFLMTGCRYGGNSGETYRVQISIRCDNAVAKGLCEQKKWKDILPEDGVILPDTEVEVQEGDTVFDLLCKIRDEEGIQMEYNGGKGTEYIEGIGNLYEFDGGRWSGWMYSVNGEYQNMGCGKCKLADGDVVRWDYTCDLGLDLDADMPGAQEWMDTHE